MNRILLVVLLFSIVCISTKAMAGEEGFLNVSTDPPGVEVWLGNNFIGNTPIISKKIETGSYEVKLIDPIQKVSLVEQVVISKGTTVVLEKKIVPKYGTLKINTVPQNANAYLTVPLGSTPLNSDFIVPGKYAIEIRHPDKLYKPISKNVIISEGGAVELLDTLEREIMGTKKTSPKKALLRVGLGAGAIAGFIWAVVENGQNHTFEHEGWLDKAKSAATRRTLGVVAGSLCVVGFEIVAFF